VWAAPSEPRVRDWINPLWLVEKVRALRTSVQVGVVHGDLHAGNVAPRDNDVPAIIDFGWSAERAHVASDFVLMECNLRFITLRPQLADADLERFVGALAWDPDPDPATALSDYLSARWELVKVVRGAARAVFAEDTNWSREYLVPLFLVAFGLLRFARQIGNQRAAVLLIERLAAMLSTSADLPELRS
jgi:aminoglycoside phosphotransferase (APT) family kinase protein